MLGSGSAGNSALVATDHCKILVDGGLSARQSVLRLEHCGVTPEQLDGVLLTHEHGDHVCGLEILCRKFDVPIYCNRLTAEAFRCTVFLGQIRNWRIFETGAEFSICDVTVQTFPVPHDAVDPLGFVFQAGSGSLGFITDLGYVTKLIVERLRQVQTLVIETNHDEKLLQNDMHRPWPVKQRIQSRHGHLSNSAAAGVIEELLPGTIERVVLGHLSRDCETPERRKSMRLPSAYASYCRMLRLGFAFSWISAGSNQWIPRQRPIWPKLWKRLPKKVLLGLRVW